MSISMNDGNHLSQLSSSSLSKRLRLNIRKEKSDENLFVRLSSGLAASLLVGISSPQGDKSSPADTTFERDGWTHLDQVQTNGSVSFLPLCISIGDDTIIYGSYNGGTCGSSCEEDLIELPRSMISGISQDIPEFVSVYPLANVEYAVSVLVEPVSVEDWELLEIYGDFMENGGLLKQVSVIYRNQLLTLRVGKVDRVRIKVIEATARASASPKCDGSSIWPDISLDDSYSSIASNTDDTPQQFVLLIEDTEVIVSPKARSRKKNNPWSHPLRLIPCDSEWGTSLKKLSSLANRESIYVEPGFVLVHTDLWQFETKWAQVKPDNYNSKQTRVVGVETSFRIPRENAVLFIGTRMDLGLAPYRDRICLRPLMSMQEQSGDSIALEEINIEYDQRGCHEWNVPDIDLLGLPEIAIRCFENERDKVMLPIGAVVPKPSIHGARNISQRPCQWFRVKLEDVHDSDEGHYFVQLDKNDFFFPSKKILKKSKVLHSLTIYPHEVPIMQTPRQIIVSPEWTRKIADRVEFSTSAFITLYGVNGRGKTHNALILSALMSFRFHRPRLYLDCRQLQKNNPRMSEILGEIDSLFAQAREYRNAIIILDDLDILSPNLLVGDESGNIGTTHSVNPAAIDQSKLICDRLLHLFEASEVEYRDDVNCHLSVVATCSSADSLNSSLLKFSRAPFLHAKVPHLSLKDREEVLVGMIRNHHPRMCDNFDHSKISRCTEGFLPRDLEKLSLRAIRSFRTNSATNSLTDSFIEELRDFTPLAQISNSRASKGSNGSTWADIGGLFDVKEKLESTVRHPVLYRRIYAQVQTQLPRGILLYGPSGCGKSFLVPALARKCNYPVVTCKGPEILDKYIGASEAKVRELFDRASQMAPSILFLDELEALAPRRGSDSTGVTDRVVNQLLTFLDGVEDVSSGTVFIIGATSRPDKVDPAIIRPGRLEQHIYVGPPESTDEWSDLLVKIAKKWSLKPETAQALSSGEEIPKMVKSISRICPADIRAAFDTAHLNAVHRALASVTRFNDIGNVELEKEDILFGLAETRASLSENESKILEPLYNSFRGNVPAPSDAEPKAIRELKTSLR
mmetsp:Transcript_15130/g.42077  ORF Transcript_15130/g.42077 Transcript_15130/m.42077 type:complete len:1083 (+) Transcript_15130:113-3361(+)